MSPSHSRCFPHLRILRLRSGPQFPTLSHLSHLFFEALSPRHTLSRKPVLFLKHRPTDSSSQDWKWAVAALPRLDHFPIFLTCGMWQEERTHQPAHTAFVLINSAQRAFGSACRMPHETKNTDFPGSNSLLRSHFLLLGLSLVSLPIPLHAPELQTFPLSAETSPYRPPQGRALSHAGRAQGSRAGGCRARRAPPARSPRFARKVAHASSLGDRRAGPAHSPRTHCAPPTRRGPSALQAATSALPPNPADLPLGAEVGREGPPAEASGT